MPRCAPAWSASRRCKNLTDRTGLDDIRGLVSLLVQTLRFGTSIADSLRVYSEEFRDKRMQKAEEMAAKIGTKLIFPLVLCLFPGFLRRRHRSGGDRADERFSELLAAAISRTAMNKGTIDLA